MFLAEPAFRCVPPYFGRSLWEVLMQIWALSTKDPATEPQTCVEFELTQSSDSVTTLSAEFCIKTIAL